MTSPLEVIRTIIDSPMPVLENKEKYSKELNDFLSCCLQKEQYKRKSAVELMSHKWIMNNCTKDVDLEAWA